MQKNTAAENDISYHHVFGVVCYQKICQKLGSKEHLPAFSDCKKDKLKGGEGGSSPHQKIATRS